MTDEQLLSPETGENELIIHTLTIPTRRTCRSRVAPQCVKKKKHNTNKKPYTL
ncbi:hypothetical protein K2D_19280 [Enterococcus hirae]|nr:hypothetical protein K2D_19280 [Enterococcus hirae]